MTFKLTGPPVKDLFIHIFLRGYVDGTEYWEREMKRVVNQEVLDGLRSIDPFPRVISIILRAQTEEIINNIVTMQKEISHDR